MMHMERLKARWIQVKGDIRTKYDRAVMTMLCSYFCDWANNCAPDNSNTKVLRSSTLPVTVSRYEGEKVHYEGNCYTCEQSIRKTWNLGIQKCSHSKLLNADFHRMHTGHSTNMGTWPVNQTVPLLLLAVLITDKSWEIAENKNKLENPISKTCCRNIHIVSHGAVTLHHFYILIWWPMAFGWPTLLPHIEGDCFQVPLLCFFVETTWPGLM